MGRHGRQGLTQHATGRARRGWWMEGTVEQLRQEMSIMQMVRHQNIAGINVVLASCQHVFVVMEYVPGGELFTKVARGRLTEDTARRYFQQLIAIVEFCHSRGVSHMDLKPENLLLDEEGRLKVTNFGLATLPEQLRQDGLLHTQCGTPGYVTPEVLRKRDYDGACTDLWSCGVVLYVLLCGFLPFQHENYVKMYQKIFKGEYQMPPWISGEARRLIGRLLVVDPAKRISIPEIMRTPWFKKGFVPPVPSPVSPRKWYDNDGSKDSSGNISLRTCNTFQLISSMSSGLGLTYRGCSRANIRPQRCSHPARRQLPCSTSWSPWIRRRGTIQPEEHSLTRIGLW